jgi:uncharacterized protein (DUF488 family)
VTARESSVIGILNRLGGCASRLQLVKVAFLLSEESAGAPRTALYEFVPYRFGPYSFTLYYDLAQLTRDGWLETTNTDVRLLGFRREEPRELALGFAAELDRVVDRYSRIPVSDLIADVYRRYPWYTANSQDPTRRGVRLPRASAAAYTTGYEGVTVDGFMNRLLRCGIRRLIDVRCNPVARRYGFHRSTLERISADLGIEYRHLPDLGVPSERRRDLGVGQTYARLFDWYDAELETSKKSAVAEAVELVKSAPSALMCTEADPDCCHRTRLAARISVLTGLPVVELPCDEAGTVSIH